MRKKKSSKYYTRPVFKEPGSKLGTVNEHKTEDTTKNRVAIIHQLKREVDMPVVDDDISVIQPSSRTQDRYKVIVGKGTDKGSFKNRNKSLTLQNRLMNREEVLEMDFDCGTSVVTTSNLDNLEAKRLQAYGFERQPSDLSTIRREVNEMVDHVLPKPDPALDESRDEKQEDNVEQKPTEEKKEAS